MGAAEGKQSMTAESKQSMTSGDLNKLYEKTKTAIDQQLKYLNSIDDYCTSDAADAIAVLVKVGKGIPNERICERVVKYMRERQLPKLIVKILKSVAKKPDESACLSRYRTSLLMQHLLLTIDPVKLKKEVRSDLEKNGVIHPLLDDLNSCNPNTKNPMQQVRILHNIYRLRNLSHPDIDTPSIIPKFRAAHAVDILMKFVEVDNEFIQITSLRTLATIVNEKEGNRLATSGGCIEAIVYMLVKSVDAKDRGYWYKIKIDEQTEKTFHFAVWALAEGLNNLSSNDANKKAIIRHGGLPALSMILRPGNTRRLERQNVVETLSKMSFLDECKTEIVTHLTHTDSVAYEGM